LGSQLGGGPAIWQTAQRSPSHALASASESDLPEHLLQTIRAKIERNETLTPEEELVFQALEKRGVYLDLDGPFDVSQ
jgi:hypothetical protein